MTDGETVWTPEEIGPPDPSGAIAENIRTTPGYVENMSRQNGIEDPQEVIETARVAADLYGDDIERKAAFMHGAEYRYMRDKQLKAGQELARDVNGETSVDAAKESADAVPEINDPSETPAVTKRPRFFKLGRHMAALLLLRSQSGKDLPDNI